MTAGDAAPSPDPNLTDEELRAVRDALTGRPAPLDLARALEARAKEDDSERIMTLACAFMYDLVEASQDGRRATAGGPYASMIGSGADAFPPQPADVPEQARAVWRVARDAIDDPIVRARIGDLLYVGLGKAAYADGRSAAQALVELAAAGDWSPLDRAVAMGRAMEIAKELNDRETLAAAIPVAVELVDELLGQEYPGPPFAVVRALIDLKAKDRPQDLSALLDRVIDRFASTPHHEGALALAARATTDDGRRRDLQRRRLQVRVDEVDNAEKLTKVVALQRAIELAREYGFQKDADELLHRQQDLPKEDLGFETFTASTEVSAEAVQSEIDFVVGSGAADLRDALRRLGQYGPPGGSNEDLDREVEEQRREFPLIDLFGHTMSGSETSAPNYIANTPESKRLLARGRQRRLYTDYYGALLLGPMLDEAVARHGCPSHDELTAHFATDLIGAVRADRIARALELFWDGHFDDSAHILVPRLESILRDVARMEGITIAKPAQEGRFAGVVSLNVVMARLRELHGDLTWIGYLEALLCDPLAINLRNDTAHGLVGHIGRANAALLLHAACYLSLLDAPSPPGP
ncbi:MAG: DUF4209 domain-containing protein [Actinomycetota bacterium]|nr:DUF4209 domain-containing protein [Actinomycetota bacterium]MDQ5807073.1 DUF4209 domain-containing protein [Actinomycetota bacterium]